MTIEARTYKRQATAMERLFTRSPFSLVTMVARVTGQVTERALTDAVAAPGAILGCVDVSGYH